MVLFPIYSRSETYKSLFQLCCLMGTKSNTQIDLNSFSKSTYLPAKWCKSSFRNKKYFQIDYSCEAINNFSPFKIVNVTIVRITFCLLACYGQARTPCLQNVFPFMRSRNIFTRRLFLAGLRTL